MEAAPAPFAARLRGLAGPSFFTLIDAIFTLRETMGVLTFFQLVKILGNTFPRQEPINLNKQINK
jgi:hypothetical protein